MNINYENYKIFYFVAKYGSITLAAKALYSEQPNVTRAIKNLEKDLKCTLFNRSNRGVSLTNEGAALYRRVAIAYEQISTAEEELTQRNNLTGGTIRIGVSETALHEALLPALVKYHALYPRIKYSLINLVNSLAISAVENQAIDFALISTPFNIDKSLVSIPVKSFQDIVVCGPRYKYLTNEKVSFAELSKHRIISLNRTTKTYEYYLNMFRKHGLDFTPNIEVSTSNQILPIVENDLGIGFIPSSFVEQELVNGKIYKLETEETIPPRDICLIKRSDSPLSIAANEFEKVLKSLYN